MKHLNILFLLLFATATVAAPLCDDSCELIITFPDGGYIEAVEPMSFSFGSGGVINDGAVTTGYADGEILALNTGESLAFAAGGSLDLGAGGNIDNTGFLVNSGGEMYLEAVGGNSAIRLTNLSVTNDATLTLVASIIDVSGVVEVSGGLNMISAGPGITQGCNISSDTGLVISAGNALATIDTAASCISIATDLRLDVLTAGVISVPSGLINTDAPVAIEPISQVIVEPVLTPADPAVAPDNGPVDAPVADAAPADDPDNPPTDDDSGSGAVDIEFSLLILLFIGCSRCRRYSSGILNTRRFVGM